MLLVAIISCLVSISSHASTAPILVSDTALSTAGYFRLSWPGQEKDQRPYELQQATQSDFSDARTRYRGLDEATVISGLGDDIYYYRVRYENSSAWSDTVEVEVKHHSLSRAFGFFILGAIMFVATVIVLLKGARGEH